MAFTDKNQFGTVDPEDGSPTGPFPPESVTESSDEESPDDEFAELSEEEMKPFTVADWKRQFPDLSVEEFEEKIPDRSRSRWMAWVVSCLWGTLLGAAFAGLLINQVPAPRQQRMFLAFFALLAPCISLAGHWFFVTRPNRIAEKLEKEEVSDSALGTIHPE
jgi:hypothetical protein